MRRAAGLGEAHESAGTPPRTETGAPAGHLSRANVLFRLLKLSNLITRPFFVHFAERYELSLNDLRVLMTLAMVPSSASHELADATGMHPMNVSRSVAVLVRQGRIEARRDPDNRRRKILTLTADGQEVERALIPHVRKIAAFLFDPMTPLEVEFLSKLLDLLIGRLEEVDPGSPELIDLEALSAAPEDGGTRARRRRKAAD